MRFGLFDKMSKTSLGTKSVFTDFGNTLSLLIQTFVKFRLAS